MGLAAAVLFYGVAVMYPIQFLPTWAQSPALLFPFTQIMQRKSGALSPASTFPTFTPYYLGSIGRLFPIAITLVLAVFSLWLFHRESPHFAERV